MAVQRVVLVRLVVIVVVFINLVFVLFGIVIRTRVAVIIGVKQANIVRIGIVAIVGGVFVDKFVFVVVG